MRDKTKATIAGKFDNGEDFEKDVIIEGFPIDHFDNDPFLSGNEKIVDAIKAGAVRTDSDPPGIFMLDCTHVNLLVVEFHKDS